ncbi:MAG TPA: hypothetical protein VG756_19560 [Pseudonocardiaceae bacterium]|nr:hypothetical protein [Pseudonocardiaceae bacterium]
MAHLPRKLAGVSAAALAALGIGMLTPAAANAITPPAPPTPPTRVAAPACWDAHFTRTDPTGRTYEAYECVNQSPTDVYSSAGYSGNYGTLQHSPSWFACRTDNQPNGENGPHKNRWLYTQADSPGSYWGFVPDTHIFSETDPVPDCDFGP